MNLRKKLTAKFFKKGARQDIQEQNNNHREDKKLLSNSPQQNNKEQNSKEQNKKRDQNKKEQNNKEQNKKRDQNKKEQNSKEQNKINQQDKTQIKKVTFEALGLSKDIVDAVKKLGYENPTPIQQAAISDLIDGRDLLGCAQTGTGKTAAFALPTLQRLSQKGPKKDKVIQVLVLTPTRELALQIFENYKDYGRNLDISPTVIFGGVNPNTQKTNLRRGTEILIATPGRFLDLYNQKLINLDHVETLVLDEADRMLDMGFIADVKKILKFLPQQRQNILFSATMPDAISELASKILKNPVKVKVAPVSSANAQVEQKLYFVHQNNKRKLLLYVLEQSSLSRVLVFTRTKSIANRICKLLTENKIHAAAIHGNKSQGARQKALAEFKTGKIRVLVASDLAARGLDVDDITHVINFDLPNVAETYVHRIGRTGRASSRGIAISFCDQEEESYIKSIEKLINEKILIETDHPYHREPENVQPRLNSESQKRSNSKPNNNSAQNKRSRSKPGIQSQQNDRSGSKPGANLGQKRRSSFKPRVNTEQKK